MPIHPDLIPEVLRQVNSLFYEVAPGRRIQSILAFPIEVKEGLAVEAQQMDFVSSEIKTSFLKFFQDCLLAFHLPKSLIQYM